MSTMFNTIPETEEDELDYVIDIINDFKQSGMKHFSDYLSDRFSKTEAGALFVDVSKVNKEKELIKKYLGEAAFDRTAKIKENKEIIKKFAASLYSGN